MSVEGYTPIDVPAVLDLKDHDLAIRCLEVIRSYLPTILPESYRIRAEVIAHCHHHPSNCYPAFGFRGIETWEQMEETETKVNAWVAAQGIDWLIARSNEVTALSWKELQTRR